MQGVVRIIIFKCVEQIRLTHLMTIYIVVNNKKNIETNKKCKWCIWRRIIYNEAFYLNIILVNFKVYLCEILFSDHTAHSPILFNFEKMS